MITKFLYLKTALAFLPFLFSISISAQFHHNYAPFVSNTNNKDSLIAALDKGYFEVLGLLSKDDLEPSVKSFIKERYLDRKNDLTQKIEDEYYLFDIDLDAHINYILKEIFDSNPEIPKDKIRVLVSRDPSPNAVCVGEGTIHINIGLFKYLKNESQLAFVLCHEIAHFTLNHVNDGIKEDAIRFFGKKTSRKFKKIKQLTRRSREEVREYLKHMIYERQRHSRESEIEADELGFSYFGNTSFDLSQALEILAVFDGIDGEDLTTTIPLKTYFNPKEFPFQEQWIAAQQLLSMKMQRNTEEQDSLKTHPACKERIELLEPKLFARKNETSFVQVFDYNKLVKLVELELVESYFYLKDYGKCLYHALILLQKYPDNIYLTATIGKCWSSIIHQTTKHNLSDFVPFPANRQQRGYKQLLEFIHNLSLEEMIKINYYFLDKRAEAFLKDEHFLFAFIKANEHFGFEMETAKLADLYKRSFPEGKYLNSLNQF